MSRSHYIHARLYLTTKCNSNKTSASMVRGSTSVGEILQLTNYATKTCLVDNIPSFSQRSPSKQGSQAPCVLKYSAITNPPLSNQRDHETPVLFGGRGCVPTRRPTTSLPGTGKCLRELPRKITSQNLCDSARCPQETEETEEIRTEFLPISYPAASIRLPI
jgi:hypothetical protein